MALGITQLPAQGGIIINGRLLTSDSSTPVASANVILYELSGDTSFKAAGFSISDRTGAFTIRTHSSARTFRIVASHTLYTTDTMDVVLKDNGKHAPLFFYLFTKKESLKEVVVRNTSIRISGDTIEYSAESFRKIDTRKVEDLLRNIEGFGISASGRITYRGKEIKAVLINGENLTKEQYQILTRNLNADVVNKIQVFDNFNENRIIGSVMASGEAAINLDLKDALKGKVSGSVSAATSLKNQHEADANLLWFKGKLKSVNLFNYNSIARDGYRELSTGLNALANDPEASLATKLYRGTGLVVPPFISLPSISKTYLNRNQDVVFSPLLHVKVNNTIKLAFRYSSLYQLGRFSDQSLAQVIVNPQNVWQTQNFRSLKQSESSGYFSLGLSHDNQKKFAGELYLQGGALVGKHNFYSETTGAITDTLFERFRLRNRIYGIQYKGAIKLTAFSAISATALYSLTRESVRISDTTRRYNDYWQLDDLAHGLSQNARLSNQDMMVRIAILHRKRQTSLNVSISNSMQYLGNRDNLIATSVKGSSGFKDTVSFHPGKSISEKVNTGVRGYVTRQFQSQLSGKLSGGAGIEKMTLPGVTGGYANIPVWDVLAGLLWKLKSFSSISLSMSSVKALPPLSYFTPGPFLQGNAGLFRRSLLLSPIRYSKVEIGYNAYSLLTSSSFQISAWGKRSGSDYVFGSIIDTSIIITYPIAVEGNWEYGINTSGRTYLPGIKSTIGATAYFKRDNGRTVVNNQYVDNRQDNGIVAFSFLSKLNSPINAEISYTKNFFRNMQGEGDLEIKTKADWDVLICKTRFQPVVKYYVGTDYSFIKFSGQKALHLFDVYTAYLFSKKFSVDGKLHNVFNIKRFEQISASPNSVTLQSVNAVGRYFLLRATLSF